MSIAYRLVRVNDDNHRHRSDAIDDMRAIIDRGAYWTRNDSPPDLREGTPLVGMGSHGGLGLFLHGIVAGEWGPASGDSPYRHLIPVAWADTIYTADAQAVAAEVERFNVRSWSRITQSEYRAVLRHILADEPLPD